MKIQNDLAVQSASVASVAVPSRDHGLFGMLLQQCVNQASAFVKALPGASQAHTAVADNSQDKGVAEFQSTVQKFGGLK
ncbi:MAG: hypothetical protein EPO06_01520 [Burkholderiaceae bacterium]|nr:MAG: hypothetical protein EPO06_01520 [Burkholderiaceae bacterium]